MTKVRMRAIVRNLASRTVSSAFSAKALSARRAGAFSILAMLIATLVAIPVHAQLSTACQAITAGWSSGVTVHPGDPIYYQAYVGFASNEEIYYTIQSSGTAPFELNAAFPGDGNAAFAGLIGDGLYDIVPEQRPNGGAEVNLSGVVPVDPSVTYYPYLQGSLNGGATGTMTATFGCRSSLPAPAVTALSPTSGPTVGGTFVTITGTNLTGAIAVSFGGVAVPSFTVNNPTSITATVPAHAASVVDVTVTTANGTSATSAASHFTYNAPITLSPTSGALSGGTVGTAYTPRTFTSSGGVAPYTYAITSGSIPTGMTLSAAGTLSGTPTTVQNTTFTVQATDALANTGSANYTLAIAPAVPIVGSVAATVAANSSSNPISLSISGGVATSVAVASAASHGTATASGTSITYTPTAGYSGSDSFTYTATNTSGTSAPATVTVTVSPPTLGISPASGALPGGTEGVAYSQTFTASAGTAPYAYTIASGILPTGLTLSSATATLSGTPTTTGTYVFSIQATDAHGATGTRSYTLTIALATPVAGPSSVTVAANSSANPITLNLSGGAAASVTVASASSHGTATASGTTITYTPVAGYSGSDSFTYTATNTSGTSAPATVTITVSAPALVFSPAGGTLPGGTVSAAYSQPISATGGTAPYSYSTTTGQLPAGFVLNTATGTISGTPTTVESQTFTVQAIDAYGATGTAAYTIGVAAAPLAAPIAGNVSVTVGANTTANAVALALSGGTAASVAVASAPSHGTATASGTSITYTPTPGYSGADNFTYTATNASGTSAPAMVTVTVTAPTFSFTPSSGTLTQGTVGVAYTQSIAATVGTAPYTYNVTSGHVPAGLTLNASSGTLAGTPTTVESQTFTVTATDTYGATGTATYTLAIVAAPVALPVAGNVSQTVAANSSANSVTLALSGGPATSVAIASASSHGTATASGTSITYTPTPGYSGADNFTYTATNASGTSAPATVTVTVTAPTFSFTPSSGTLTHGTVGVAYTQSIAATAGTAPYTYNVTSGHVPAGLTLNASSGTLAGTPTTVESQTFTVTAADTYGATGTATYTLAIVAAPVALPVAGNVSQTVAANSSANSVTLALSGGPATSVAIASAPSHGTATAVGTSITYTPSAGYSGTDSFTYTATNVSGTSAPATVSITVNAPTLAVTPPSGALPNGTVGIAYSQTLSVTAGLAPYHYVATGLPTGLAINASTGAITGTPTTAGNANVSVTVHDAGAATATIAYTLTIAAPNPTAASLTAATVGGRTTAFNLTTGATGGPFTAATVVGMTPAGAATATIVTVDSTTAGRTFQLNVTPNRGFGGTIVVAYRLTNAANLSASGTATLVVEARPDPSADPGVRALSDAQTEAARRFSHAQVDNFMRRAESLHDVDCGRSQMGIRLASSDAVRNNGIPHTFGDTTVQRISSAISYSESEYPESESPTDRAAFMRNRGSTKRCGESIAVWASGVLDVGSRSAVSDRSKLSAATAGLSVGVDKAVANHVNLGLGVGVGTDGTNVAGGDAHSAADAQTIAMYGSASLAQGVFVDGMVSHGWIDFGTRRLVPNNATTALGHREGHFSTATLSTGADRQFGALRWSLYGRGEYLNGTLDSYGETGADVYNLRFDARDVRSMLGVFGFRAAHREALHVGILSPSIRGEWQHEFTDGTNQTLDYADLDGPSFYTIATQGWSREQFTVIPSLDLVVPSGWKFNVELGLRAADGERATTSRVQIGKVF